MREDLTNSKDKACELKEKHENLKAFEAMKQQDLERNQILYNQAQNNYLTL